MVPGSRSQKLMTGVSVVPWRAAVAVTSKPSGSGRPLSKTTRPVTTAPVDGDTAETLFKLIDTLEDNDDVQTVSANFEVSDALAAKMSA